MLSAVDAERASGDGRHDIVVLRGRRLVYQVVTDDDFRGRLWAYLTDIPQSIPAMTPDAVSWLAGVAKAVAVRAVPDRGAALLPGRQRARGLR